VLTPQAHELLTLVRCECASASVPGVDLGALLVAFGTRLERLLLLIPSVASKLEPFKQGDYGWHGLIRVMPTIWGVLGLMFVAEILVFVALFFVAVL